MNRDEGAYSLSDLWTGLISTTLPSGKKELIEVGCVLEHLTKNIASPVTNNLVERGKHELRLQGSC